MKRLVFILMVLMGFGAVAQVTDSFTDGDFTNNPAWSGDVASWTLVAGQLQSNGAAVTPTTIYLSTPSTIASNAQWDFFANPKCATSSGNFMDIYLIADAATLTTANGYFVRLGGTDDEVSLFKKVAGVETKIIDGTNTTLASSSSNPTKVRVKRTTANDWTLEADFTGTGSTYALQGTINDATITTSAFFGIKVTYSAANNTKYILDDVSVAAIVVDVTPPTITAATATSSTTVDILFSEAVDLVTSETEANYSVNNGMGIPTTATRSATNNALVSLTYASSFTSGLSNTVTINNVADFSANIIAANSTTSFTYNAPVTAQPFDVVISEIMFEPASGTQLPNDEYVEIYNRSNNAVNLSGWLLSDGGSTTPNFGSYVLQPDSFLILCAASDVTLFSPFGSVLGLSSFPLLNNDVGDNLTLTDNTGTLIDEVIFDNDFYNNTAKDDGGYSIEKIDLNFTCTDIYNWKASNDIKGGTPGKQNSVNGTFTDTSSPELVRAYPVTSSIIDLFFTEPVDKTIGTVAVNYSVSGGIGTPLGVVVSKNKATLVLASPLLTGTVYTVTVSALLKDCPGNLIIGDLTVNVALAEAATAGNILLNEILFNPVTDGFDYVEIYNASTKTIDLKDIYVTNVNTATNVIDTKYLIYPEGYLLFPGNYLALTESISATATAYPTEEERSLLQVAALPSYNDDEGAVAIADFSLSVIDQFNYKDDYHYAILNDKEGASLERISFGIATQNKTNWHTAAQTVHYGTPGYKNSQSITGEQGNDELIISPEVFSPDNDGYNDVLAINYNLPETGYTATVSIYDGDGRLIKDIANNQLVSPTGLFTWDGISNTNEKARIGIYVIFMEAVNSNGSVKKFKKSCVVAGKL